MTDHEIMLVLHARTIRTLDRCEDDQDHFPAMVARRLEALIARVAELEAVKATQHPDDAAVDQFAGLLKSKLAKARAKGRCGWRDPSWSAADINRQMHEHAAKGDPLDVAAYAMFLSLRGEATTGAQVKGGGDADPA